MVNLLVFSLMCVGIRLCRNDGMILYKPATWLYKKLPEWLTTPLFGCITCMGSFYGVLCWLVTYASTFYHNPIQLLWIPVYLFALAGLNTLIYSIIEFLDGWDNND